MELNINQPNGPSQGQSEEKDSFIVFRFQHSPGKRIKGYIKSLGCSWNGLHHGWLCPAAKQKEVHEIIEKANINCTVQSLLLPKGMIPADQKIAGRQARLEILEEQFHNDSSKLLEDVYRYDSALRPEDFAEPPSKDSKSQQQLFSEEDFHNRWCLLQKTKHVIEQARQELSHLNSDPGEKILDPDAPLLIGDALIQEHFLHDELQTLQHCSNMFWKWEGTKYVEFSEDGMRQAIYNFLRDAKKPNDSGYLEGFNPNKFKVDQIIDALRATCHKDYTPASGAIWLDGREEPHPKHLISFRNGLLNMKDWFENPSADLIRQTPLLLNVNSLNFDFDPHAAEPQQWQKFLNTLWPDDIESQQTLQEWTGYLLTQETRLHKILLIIGPPRSGKGTIGRILHELLGPFNVVGPTLSSLGGEFGLQPLLNKMLATISDARLNGRGQNSLIIERLLSISGEDPLTISRKFLPSITVQLPTRIMMMSNELPDMRDASGALAKRYIVLTLQKSWLGQEDTNLFYRLRSELPSILVWALKGLARLQERGKFLQPRSSIQIIEELEAMTSPIKAFISERCIIDPLAMVSVSDLFDAWRDWCSITGHPYSGNIQSFGKNVRAAFPDIEITRPQEDGTRERYYQGISLSPIHHPSADVRGPSWKGFE